MDKTTRPSEPAANVAAPIGLLCFRRVLVQSDLAAFIQRFPELHLPQILLMRGRGGLEI